MGRSETILLGLHGDSHGPRETEGAQGREADSPQDHQEASLPGLSNSSSVYPAVWCDQLRASAAVSAWAALSSITLGSK